MRKLIVLVFFMSGFWLISGSGFMLLKAHLSEILIKEAWLQTLEDKTFHKPWSWADTYPILQLQIPRIDKGSYILEGANGRNMAFSAAHTANSGLPGQNKTTIISGHRDSHFEYLKDIVVGDKIVTNGVNGTHQYKVVEMKVINSQQETLKIINKDELILTTCYPFSSLRTGGNLRFVVYALPV